MKALLARLAATNERYLNVGLLVLRSAFGLTMAFSHGYGKITNLAAFSASVGVRGVPAANLLGPLAALSEFVGGLLIAVGLFTRLGATGILITMLVAAFHIHAADPFGRKEMALLYAFVSIVLLLTGPGRYSLDHKWFRQEPPAPPSDGET